MLNSSDGKGFGENLLEAEVSKYLEKGYFWFPESQRLNADMNLPEADLWILLRFIYGTALCDSGQRHHQK